MLARRDARAREKTLRLKRENNRQRIPDGSLRDDSEDAFHPPFNSSSAERTRLRFLSTDTRLFPSSFRCSPLLSSPPRTPRRLLLSPPFLIFPCFDVRHAISFHSRTPVTRAFFPCPRLSIIGLLFPRLSIFRPPLYSIVVVLRAERTYESYDRPNDKRFRVVVGDKGERRYFGAAGEETRNGYTCVDGSPWARRG